jgi:hypothetical protein
MGVLIQFPEHAERLRAIDVLAEAEETYHGVPPKCYLVSETAARLLESKGIRFQVVGDKAKEPVHGAGS